MPDRPDRPARAASRAVVHGTAFARVQVGRPTRLVVVDRFAHAGATESRQILEDAPDIAAALGCEWWVGHDQRLEVVAPASRRFTTEDW